MTPSKPEKKLNINEAIETIGGLGLWQLCIYAYLSYNVFFGAAINMSIIFLEYTPDAVCVLPIPNRWSYNETQKLSELISHNTSTEKYCERLDINVTAYKNRSFADVYDSIERDKQSLNYTKCDAWHYDRSVMRSSIVTEWNFMCQNQIQVANTHLAYVVGFLFGTLLSGLISDRLGRARVITWGYVCSAVVGIVMCQMTSFTLFLIFRFFLAFFINASFAAAYVTGIEITTTKHRQLIGSLAYVPYSAAYVAIAGIAYASQEWRTFHMIIVVPLAINVVAIFLLPESPRWLVSKGKVEEAKVILRRAAKLNRVKDTSFLDADLEYDETEKTEVFYHVCKFPVLVLRVFVMCFIWFVNALVYYGISLNVTSFVGNVYANNAIAGAIEFPAYILAYFGLQWGRKKSTCLALLICGAALIPIPFVNSGSGTMGLAMVGKLFITTSFTIIYVYTNELYPTVVRTAGLCISSVIGRFGSISAPYITVVGTTNPSIKEFPMIFFGVLAVAAGFITLALPETRNRHLPEYLEDSITFTKEKQGDKPMAKYGATQSQVQLVSVIDPL